MDALPFTATTSAVESGTVRETRYHGLLRFDVDALILEFRDRVTEMGKGGVQTRNGAVAEVRIPLGAVRSLEPRKRWFRAHWLDIELARLEPAESVPWAEGTRIRLTIPRPEAPRLRDLSTEVQLLKADARLRELGEGDLTG